MKKSVFLFCLFWSCYAVAQKNNSACKAITGNIEAQQKFWNEGDIKGFMSYYWNSDSLKFIGSKGITFGWQKTLDNYLKSYPTKEAMGILTFKMIECISLSASSAYVIGKWDLQKEKPSGGYFTLLWKKINDKWVIVADHTS